MSPLLRKNTHKITNQKNETTPNKERPIGYRAVKTNRSMSPLARKNTQKLLMKKGNNTKQRKKKRIPCS